MMRTTLLALALLASGTLANAGTYGWTPGEPTVTPGPGGIHDYGGLGGGHSMPDGPGPWTLCKPPYPSGTWWPLIFHAALCVDRSEPVIPPVTPPFEEPEEPETPPVVVVPEPQPAPVPVPAGLPLLVAGLGAFGALRWRAQ